VQADLVLLDVMMPRAAGRLFERADKLLFMSATVGKVQQFLAGLNLRESEAAWHCANSEFPVNNRRVQFFTVGSMSRQNQAQGLPVIIKACQGILAQRPNVKGAILVNSYPLASKLAAQLGPRILTHMGPDDKDEILARHCQFPKPTVLIGVATFEALDLKDDLARFLILPKIPYPYLGDPYIAERKNRDPHWHLRQTTLAVVQACGRVVRTPTDWAEIAILDSGFASLLRRPDLFPKWFLEAVEVNGKKPPQRVTPAAPSVEIEGN
jgi:ATP-dependent DNA helicase DinG